MPDPHSHNTNEAITAVKPTASSMEEPARADSPVKRTRVYVWVGLMLLLMVAAAVIFLLPDIVKTQSPVLLPEKVIDQPMMSPPDSVASESETVRSEPQEIPLSSPEDSEQNQQDRLQAEKLLGQIIELESALQKQAVNLWAAEEYAAAREQGRVGDEFFRIRNYAQAVEAYGSAVEQLQALAARADSTLEKALFSGEAALSRGDQPTAQQQFQLAKAIDASNVRATQGLQRAATLTELFELLQRGSRYESHNQLHQAREVYEQARSLDALSQEAQNALARVNSKLAQEEFERTLSAAYTALQNRQYEEARNSFNAARTLQPDSEKPKQGLGQLDKILHEEQISSLLFEAQHFESQQQWELAAGTYQKIIALSGNHPQAQQGLPRAQRNARLLTELQSALANSDELYREQVLMNAQRILADVNTQTEPGSSIEHLARQLAALVQTATTPITVTLESDGQTDVVVYKVARLGSFDRHELQLRPGSYTIVGTRPGYRDVRHTLVVTAENHNLRLLVQCEEPI